MYNQQMDTSYGHQQHQPDPVIAMLLSEREQIDPSLTNVHKAIQDEIEKRSGYREPEYIEIDINRKLKLSKKIMVPLHRNPGFNYVGKLMGPGGSTLKKMQEKHACKIHVLGRGSSKDKNKEQELLMSGDPKYSHYNENLHVKVDILDQPVEAYRKMAEVLDDIKAHFNPDLEDEISKAQKDEGFVPKEPKTTNFKPSNRGDGGYRGRGRGAPNTGGFGMMRGGRGMSRGGGSGRGMAPPGRGAAVAGYGSGMSLRPPAPAVSDYGGGDYGSQQSSGYYNASYNDQQYGQSQPSAMGYGNPNPAVRPGYNAMPQQGYSRPPMGMNGSAPAIGGGKMAPAGGQMYGAGGYGRMHPYGGAPGV